VRHHRWRRAGSLAVATVPLVLAGCAASAPARPVASATVHPPAAAPRPATPQPATPVITVAGDHPVPPNGSQDTYAQTPGTTCDPATLAHDQAIGAKIAAGFNGAGLTVSADLLTHFLRGVGTEVDFPAGSVIAQQALASAAFQAVNSQVQLAVLSQLQAGRTRVRLSAAQLPAVTFASSGGDLYWGFRGTQGLTVTGRIHRTNGRYVGTLSYVIRDSYGFPADDTLAGFGPPMRYLQTACGAPRHAGGAHWFPDTITVTAPFRRPA